MSHVDVMLRETANGQRAHFHGVLRCGSPFSCPVCSAALRTERAAEVTRCVKWWKNEGGDVELLTLTFRHGMGDDLRALNRGRQEAWRKLTQGDSWKRLAQRLGIQYWVRGTDDTHGRHGWHPHFHVILFTRPPENKRARELALRDLRKRWVSCVRRALGDSRVPSWRGADLRECHREEYISKLGLELVSPDTKEAKGDSRTPWQIAMAAAAEDEHAIELWQRYTLAMKGVRQLTWSRGLRDAARLGEERSDKEIVDGQDNGQLEAHVASIPAHLWDEIAGRPGVAFAVLRAAETSGTLGVATILALYLWGVSPPSPGEPIDPIVLKLVVEMTPTGKYRVAA